MDDKKMLLKAKYDALIRTRREIRAAVRDEYRDVIKAETEARTKEADLNFANELVALKEAGMKRVDIADAIRTNDHSRLKYFLDLAGSDGFRRGRPQLSDLEKAIRSRGFKIEDAYRGVVTIYRMGKVEFSEPQYGEFKYEGGQTKYLLPYEGSDVSEFMEWRKNVRPILTGSEQSRVNGELETIKDELLRAGWNQYWRSDEKVEPAMPEGVVIELNPEFLARQEALRKEREAQEVEVLEDFSGMWKPGED